MADTNQTSMEENASASCCCDTDEVTTNSERHVDRSEKERKALLRRLSIIEGQVRGIKKMLEDDVYCIDILTQVSAANCALNSFSKELLSNHLSHCVANDLKNGSDEKMEELIKILPKLMR